MSTTHTRYRVDAIPAELKALDRWVVFQIVREPNGKTKKIPLIPGIAGRHLARADDPATWRPFDLALRDAEARGLFLAFVFSPEIPYFFVDADDAWHDAVRADVAVVVDALGTYTEISAGGAGLHIVGRGAFPPNPTPRSAPEGRKALELYPRRGGRFCVFTGDVLAGLETIEDRGDALARLFPPRAVRSRNGSANTIAPTGALTDAEADAVVSWAGAHWTDGRRHHMALFLSGELARQGVSRDQAAAIVERCAADDADPAAKLNACHDTYDAHEAGETTSGWRGLQAACSLSDAELAPLGAVLEAFWQRQQATIVRSTGTAADLADAYHGPVIGTTRCSDLGNSLELAARLAGRFRSVPAAKQWRVYLDGRWQPDTCHRVSQECKQTILNLYGRLADVEDAKDRKKLRDHIQRSESQRAIQAAIALAMTDPRLATAEGGFDAKPGLLNVRNGTIELATGVFRNHDPDDLLTKQAPIHYDPDATAPTWQRFVAEIVPDQSQRDWLQMYLGYAAAGNPVEQIVAMAYGDGQNGKSTLIDVVCGVMGPYAMRSDIETFLTQRTNAGGGAASPDIARLPGVRYLFAAEPGAGRRLNAGRVKEMSGGEKIVARHLYGAPFEFEPQFTLWISTNKKPIVPGNDPGLWRRLRLIPFTVKVPEERRILGLADAILEHEAPGVLNWILEGLAVWREVGRLPNVEAIRQATDEYRTESDEVGQFIAQRCQVGPGLRVLASELYQEFVRWLSKEFGSKPPTQTAFGRDLGERGFDSYKDGLTYRIGLSLVSENPPNRIIEAR